jgi:hypothetical protein
VGLAGIEPATSALSVLRSNRLSYSPEVGNNLFNDTIFPRHTQGPASRVRSTCDIAVRSASQWCLPRLAPPRVGPRIDLKGKLRRLVTHPIHQGSRIYSAGSELRRVESLWSCGPSSGSISSKPDSARAGSLAFHPLFRVEVTRFASASAPAPLMAGWVPSAPNHCRFWAASVAQSATDTLG